MKCESCGMPSESKYCEYCADSEGNLKPRAEVREEMIAIYMKTKKKTREEAEEFIDYYMSTMPAWE